MKAAKDEIKVIADKRETNEYVRAKYKNVMCREYMKGHCIYDENCWYSHKKDRFKVDKNAICRNYEDGSCLYGDNCWYYHPNGKQNLGDYLNDGIQVQRKYRGATSSYKPKSRPAPYTRHIRDKTDTKGQEYYSRSDSVDYSKNLPARLRSNDGEYNQKTYDGRHKREYKNSKYTGSANTWREHHKN